MDKPAKFSKKVYYVNGNRFYNTCKEVHDGRQKATDFCLAYGLNPNSSIIVFDSDTETDYYDYLLERQKKGEIKDLEHHFQVQLINGFINANGDKMPPITYEIDFVYYDIQKQKKIYVDVKGNPYFIDDRFSVIKLLFDRIYLKQNGYVQVICYDKTQHQWYEWHIGDKKKSGKLLKKQREQIKQLKAEQHRREIQDRLEVKERQRYRELLEMSKVKKLTKPQRERLQELGDKYGTI